MKHLLGAVHRAFTGTVEQAEGTTVPDVPVDARTVVVRVGEVLHAPAEVGLEPAAQITVQLAEGLPPLAAGERAACFANGLAYEESLAVAVVGRSSTAKAAAPTARRSRTKRVSTPAPMRGS